jgi:hypothetical protein
MKRIVALYTNFKYRNLINRFKVGDYIYVHKMRLGKALPYGDLVYKIDDVVWAHWFTPAYLCLKPTNSQAECFVNVKDIARFSVYSGFEPKFKLGQPVYVDGAEYQIDHCDVKVDKSNYLYFQYVCVNLKNKTVARVAEEFIQCR